jgi:hypothetical protein
MAVKLKTTYEKAEDVPPGFEELYTERGGKLELSGVEGVKTQADIDRVQAALVKERNDLKEAQKLLGKFEGFNPDELPAQLEELTELRSKVEGLKADGKLNEEQIAARVEASVARATGPFQRDLKTANAALEAARNLVKEKDGVIQTLTTSQKQENIRRALRDAAIDAKVISPALDDAVLVGERMFEMSEDGKLVTKADAGCSAGLSPKEWAKEMQAVRPHWFPVSQGGGAAGGRGPLATGKENPWSRDGWNITEQGRKVKEFGEAKAAEMAAKVGSKLGAIRPPKPASAA